jgi:hypothetical protein
LEILIPKFTKAAAFLARAVRRVEREQTRIELFKCATATGTTHFRAHHRQAILRIEQMGGAAADLDRALGEIPRFENPLRVDHTNYHVDGVFFETLQFSKMRNRNELPVDVKRVEALAFGPTRHVSVKSFSRFD